MGFTDWTDEIYCKTKIFATEEWSRKIANSNCCIYFQCDCNTARMGWTRKQFAMRITAYVTTRHVTRNILSFTVSLEHELSAYQHISCLKIGNVSQLEWCWQGLSVTNCLSWSQCNTINWPGNLWSCSRRRCSLGWEVSWLPVRREH